MKTSIEPFHRTKVSLRWKKDSTMIKIFTLRREKKGNFKNGLLKGSVNYCENSFLEYLFLRVLIGFSYPLVDVDFSPFGIHDSGWLVSTTRGKAFLNYDNCQGQHCITNHYNNCVVF